jgi:hypothetical protein
MPSLDIQLSKSEKAMFGEIFSILKKYNGSTRAFGMQLIHTHFDVGYNEILHETHDEEKRILKIKPVFLSDVPQTAKPTAWGFSEMGKPKVIQMCCDGD